MWHKFTLTREEDVLNYGLATAHNASSGTSQVSYCPDNIALDTSECVTPKTSDGEYPDEPSPTQTQEQRQQRGKKQQRETKSVSPLTRKILAMQQQLNNLVKERTMSRQRQATRQQNSCTYIDCDSKTEPETSN
jgi:hypothetical protein